MLPASTLSAGLGISVVACETCANYIIARQAADRYLRVEEATAFSGLERSLAAQRLAGLRTWPCDLGELAASPTDSVAVKAVVDSSDGSPDVPSLQPPTFTNEAGASFPLAVGGCSCCTERSSASTARADESLLGAAWPQSLSPPGSSDTATR
jgi:hypothetical protein